MTDQELTRLENELQRLLAQNRKLQQQLVELEQQLARNKKRRVFLAGRWIDETELETQVCQQR